ncbi:SDR family NAD(P)-dependent oxidoreductase [Parasphingopyxis marina]|uniref:SDR family NAD(P)-dependent oxidoreductase n=1 Tax=Parasphingopyxis marina TaxID=2761622 RepID=A0A842HZ62_9SPHN|nr:SDR family NAD(P)-dependent oxidoreductase [Parasphingopyxis marina]MBC2776784.1 SDR family NAD(P)-dependent oxidoreductase [Parasphingopyxis marina]
MTIDSFEGKIAFITGGASGIGLGIAKALVGRGAFAILADMRQDHLDEAVAAFAAAGQGERVEPLLLDVTDRAGFEAAAQDIDARHCGIDILVNNAGVGTEGPLRQATYADWDFGLGVNIGGVVNGIVTFMPRMIARAKERGGGHIVNTASLAGTVQMPGTLGIYATSKGAVISLSEALRNELEPDGIGVTALLPGFVKSNIHEAKLNRPAHLREGSGYAESEEALSERVLGDDWMEPEEAGEMVAKGILENAPFVVTHGIFRDAMQAKFDAVMEATPPA